METRITHPEKWISLLFNLSNIFLMASALLLVEPSNTSSMAVVLHSIRVPGHSILMDLIT